MKDECIIEQLKSGNKDKMFVALYKYFPVVKKLITSKGGSKSDAEDIFQEALIIFYRKIQQKDFTLTSSIQTYVYGICRLLWKNELKKRKHELWSEMPTDLSQSDEKTINLLIEFEEKIKVVEKVLIDLGKRCLEILKLFYYHSLKMKDIAAKMGFKSEKVAKNQKYKCIERARLTLEKQMV